MKENNIIISSELYEDVISKLEEANEWAAKNKHIDEMEYIQDLTYEALLFLTTKKEDIS